MAIQIQILNGETKKETTISEVVSIVIEMMDKSKSSQLSPEATGEDENH